MNRDLSINLEKYEIEIKKLYPFLTDEEVKELTFEMFQVLKKWFELEFEEK